MELKTLAHIDERFMLDEVMKRFWADTPNALVLSAKGSIGIYLD